MNLLGFYDNTDMKANKKKRIQSFLCPPPLTINTTKIKNARFDVVSEVGWALFK